MTTHDHSYKLLFSHPQMVRDLLEGFIREDWLAELDFHSLQKVNATYITDDLRERADDLVWRLRWGPSWIYLYLLLEFQSSVERSEERRGGREWRCRWRQSPGRS